MTLRTYGPMKKSRGTVIPPTLRIEVLERDRGCVGARFSETPCAGGLELDHVRASHGIGMKSRTEADNLVALCGKHHLEKTLNGREWRPILLSYIDATRSLSPTAEEAGAEDGEDTAPRRGTARW